MSSSDLYRDAGVDITAGNEAAKRYAALVGGASNSGMLTGLGGFAGGFQLDLERFPQPVLFSGTDGVGTKLKIAFATGLHNTVGIDCVAMCVNDVLTSGAEPLLFLDYLATGKLDVDIAEQVVAGVAAGCEQAGCVLVGGETAEMPGMYTDGEYDLAGFTVGAANKSDVIDGSGIQVGDAIIGLASNGLHSNGFSLVRKVVAEAGLEWSDAAPFGAADFTRAAISSESIGKVLLSPTRIYVKPILQLLSRVKILGMAHITGGGLVENIPRVLPGGCGVMLRPALWQRQPVFDWLQTQTGMDFEECARVWNMGIGFVVVVRQADITETLRNLTEFGERAQVVGEVVAGGGVQFDA